MGTDCRWMLKFRNYDTVNHWVANGLLYQPQEVSYLSAIQWKMALKCDSKGNLQAGYPEKHQHSLDLISFINGSDIRFINSSVRTRLSDLPDDEYVSYQFNRTYCKSLYDLLLDYCNPEDIYLGGDVSLDMRDDYTAIPQSYNYLDYYNLRTGVYDERVSS